MKRRSFLGGMIAAGMAPAIVRASSLMKIQPIEVAEFNFFQYSIGFNEISTRGFLVNWKEVDVRQLVQERSERLLSIEKEYDEIFDAMIKRKYERADSLISLMRETYQ